MIGGRTRSREVALQVLFSIDTRPADAVTLSDPGGYDHSTLRDAEASESIKAFAGELVDGVLAHRDAIDELIRTAADNWDLERLAAVDRCVLRLAVYELTERDDIPPKVTINEAIELGKRYSGAQSGAFINGILDRVRKDLGLSVEMPPIEEDSEGRPLEGLGEQRPAGDDA